MNRKLLGAAVFSVALAGGAGVGALLGVPGTSAAQESAEPEAEVVHFGGPRGAGLGFANLEVAAEALGISVGDLRDELADGSSIADVAEERAVDVQDVIDALVADATERLNEIEAELPETIGNLVEREGVARFRHHGGFGRGIRLAVLDVAAEALGVSEEDLRESLADGSSIADVAEERNVDVQDVIDALVADATANIDEKVADGDLDADRAAELKENLPERIAELVQREGGGRRFGPRSFEPGPGPGPDGFVS